MTEQEIKLKCLEIAERGTANADVKSIIANASKIYAFIHILSASEIAEMAKNQ